MQTEQLHGIEMDAEEVQVNTRAMKRIVRDMVGAATRHVIHHTNATSTTTRHVIHHVCTPRHPPHATSSTTCHVIHHTHATSYTTCHGIEAEAEEVQVNTRAMKRIVRDMVGAATHVGVYLVALRSLHNLSLH